MNRHEALGEADLSHEEVRRRVGGTVWANNDVVRQRLAGLLDPSVATDDDAAGTHPDDARRCGALVVRLGGAATTTVIAGWMGWTMERTNAAVAELDRRLDRCGLRVGADGEGQLIVRERARLRARPHQLPFELAERLDAEEHRHALAHLARGDQCAKGEDWTQPLLDLGAAVPHSYPEVRPSDVIAAAFIGIRHRRLRLPLVLEIREGGERWPPADLWGAM